MTDAAETEMSTTGIDPAELDEEAVLHELASLNRNRLDTEPFE